MESATQTHDAKILHPTLAELRERGKFRGGMALLGPSFVAAVAYIDPGNFATNIAGGAQFGYLLVWVIVMANLIAMLVQYLSAKTGIATGRNLAELCREKLPRKTTIMLWIQAEVVAIATDLAEFVGAAIALNLLFGLSPLTSGLITAVVAFAILGLQQRGYRRFELVIAGMLAIVCIGFLFNLFKVDVNGGQFLGGLVPKFDGTDSLLLAVGILGATVMPHVVWLHSALTQDRVRADTVRDKRKLIRYERFDVLIAMSVAGVINLSMLVIAAALFHDTGQTSIDTIEGAYAVFETDLGKGAALAFAIALLSSGLSSSSVGTYAGQVVMQGFVNIRIPLFFRRALTMAPSLIVLGMGANTTDVLIFSQVILSFGIPFALVPMLILTSKKSIMGELVNTRIVTALGTLVAMIVIGLNLFLLYDTFTNL